MTLVAAALASDGDKTSCSPISASGLQYGVSGNKAVSLGEW